MDINQFLLLSAFLFSVGAYGVITRKHTVLVLASIELMLAAVNLNFVAFGAFRNDPKTRVEFLDLIRKNSD